MPIANLGSKGLLRKGVLSPILVCNKDSVQEVCVVRLASSSNAYIGMILYVYWGGSTGLFFINSKTGNSYIIRKVNGSMISEIEFKRKNDHLFVRSKTNTASFRVSALFLDTTGVDLSLSMNIVDENLDDAEDIEKLIGVATSEKDGLMPSIQRMTTSYQKDQQKYCKIAEFRNRLTGISMLISVFKNHENSSPSVVLLTGYSDDLSVNSIKRGIYLTNVYYQKKRTKPLFM
ncbi:hypothetical protein NXU85_03585 [Phocaeicola vulgatus]|nr:hypothetical protein [Phocaeicola vulgatus]